MSYDLFSVLWDGVADMHRSWDQREDEGIVSSLARDISGQADRGTVSRIRRRRYFDNQQ